MFHKGKKPKTLKRLLRASVNELSIKGQRENILGFAGNVISIPIHKSIFYDPNIDKDTLNNTPKAQ